MDAPDAQVVVVCLVFLVEHVFSLSLSLTFPFIWLLLPIVMYCFVCILFLTSFLFVF